MELREDLLKEALPEEYATLAIERMKNGGCFDWDASEALVSAFAWIDSPEGYKFWSNVYDYLEGATDTLPPIPTNKEGEE